MEILPVCLCCVVRQRSLCIVATVLTNSPLEKDFSCRMKAQGYMNRCSGMYNMNPVLKEQRRRGQHSATGPRMAWTG